MKAGRWVFAAGLMAQDFVNGIAPDVAQRIFENLEAVLSAAGTDRSNLVRTDQYYTTVKAVPPYQQVRREFLRGRIPPSTSITQKRLLLPDADMTVQALAAIPDKDFAVEHHEHEHLKGRPTSGYSPALTVGDFIFIPGITSMAIGEEPRRNGIAAAALMAEGAQWGGQPIKLETEFIITQRIVPSLKLVGAGLEDVAHAQIYLTDPEDYSAFTEVWSRHFGETGPTFSVIPCIEHGLAPYHGKIEINVLALKPGGAARKRHIDASVTTALHRQPQALRAGDLLFISGLMAADRDGLTPSAARDPRQPWFSSPAQMQAEIIIGKALRSRRHLARERRAPPAIPYRHQRVLCSLQSVGAPFGRPPAAVLGGRGAGAAARSRCERADRGLGLCALMMVAHFYEMAINAHDSDAIITPHNAQATIRLAKRLNPSNFDDPTITLDFKYRENP
jgi:enamine deaminase RidA (YjgF/YER057c/UK114 family)